MKKRPNLMVWGILLPAVLLPGKVKLCLAARLQDDQPHQDKGFAASIETALRIAF